MTNSVADIDVLIAEEQKNVALESVGEALAVSRSEGVDALVFAEAAIATALEGVVDDIGEDAAANLLDLMKEQLLSGAFLRARHVH